MAVVRHMLEATAVLQQKSPNQSLAFLPLLPSILDVLDIIERCLLCPLVSRVIDFLFHLINVSAKSQQNEHANVAGGPSSG